MNVTPACCAASIWDSYNVDARSISKTYVATGRYTPVKRLMNYSHAIDASQDCASVVASTAGHRTEGTFNAGRDLAGPRAWLLRADDRLRLRLRPALRRRP